jgi:hypothetical protein
MARLLELIAAVDVEEGGAEEADADAEHEDFEHGSLLGG